MEMSEPIEKYILPFCNFLISVHSIWSQLCSSPGGIPKEQVQFLIAVKSFCRNCLATENPFSYGVIARHLDLQTRTDVKALKDGDQTCTCPISHLMAGNIFKLNYKMKQKVRCGKWRLNSKHGDFNFLEDSGIVLRVSFQNKKRHTYVTVSLSQLSVYHLPQLIFMLMWQNFPTAGHTDDKTIGYDAPIVVQTY